MRQQELILVKITESLKCILLFNLLALVEKAHHFKSISSTGSSSLNEDLPHVCVTEVSIRKENSS